MNYYLSDRFGQIRHRPIDRFPVALRLAKDVSSAYKRTIFIHAHGFRQQWIVYTSRHVVKIYKERQPS